MFDIKGAWVIGELCFIAKWLLLIIQTNQLPSQTSTTLNIYAHAVQKSNVKALNLMADLLQ